jgi:hypothetical protein
VRVAIRSALNKEFTMAKAEANLPCPKGCGRLFTKRGLPGHLSLGNCGGKASATIPAKVETKPAAQTDDASGSSAPVAPEKSDWQRWYEG